ncbi:MAG TPA: DUF2382 domain-containing protein [Bryobacteraceae bacterium]|nr:DUF2382 domain-containing protein [Bryobacteraceae bacterium]
MPEQQSQFPLVTTDGLRGVVLRRARFIDRDARSLVRLEDGREFEVPNDSLEVRQDGTFLLQMSGAGGNGTRAASGVSEPNSAASAQTAPPQAADTSSSATAQTPPPQAADVRSSTTAQTTSAQSAGSTADALFTEEAEVKRVSVNRMVTEAPQTRIEGEVTIVPVVEEVLVIEKRLLLKEEIHIVRRRAAVREPRRFVAGQADSVGS